MLNSNIQKSKAEIEVRFRDVDAMGHVNNAVYFTYMEVARTQFFLRLISLDDPLNLPVIIAEASCTFKKPARFGDTILVTINVSQIGNRSFELGYELSNQESQLVALGRTVMVAYDYEIHRAIRIPENLRTALETYRSL